MGYRHKKSKWCQCRICSKYSDEGRPKNNKVLHWYRPVYKAALTVEGICDLCRQEGLIAFHTHPAVSEFLKTTWICWDCQDLVNTSILGTHRLCFQEASTMQIQAALLDVLHKGLLREINIAQFKAYAPDGWR